MAWNDDLPLEEIDFRRFALDIPTDKDTRRAVSLSATREVRTRAIVGGLPESLELENRVRAQIEEGFGVVERIKNEGLQITIDPDQEALAEAVVLLAKRPALLVQDDNFLSPTEEWKSLEFEREAICSRLPSVGKIEIVLNGRRTLFGTGFVVSDDLIMTNRHVAKLIAEQDPVDPSVWEFLSNADPTIDFKGEHGVAATRSFRIRSVIKVLPEEEPDICLLQVETKSADTLQRPLPAPILLASEAPDFSTDRSLYVVGYPSTDNESVTPSSVLKAIFNDVFEKKRLQPGEWRTEFKQRKLFSHDCSTLGGNSGSCVVDLATDRAIGLHFKGKYRTANYAVSLWDVQDHPDLTGLGLSYEH